MSSFTGDSAIYSPLDGSRGSFQMELMQNGHHNMHNNQQDVRWNSGTDSGVNSDSPWNTSVSSYPYTSTRSSFGSVYSSIDQDQRKTSIDSSVPGDFQTGLPINGLPIDVTSGGGGQQMQRRVMRHLSTSFENHNTLSDYIGVIGESTTNVVTGGGGSDAYVSKWRRNSEVMQSDRLSNPEMARRKASGETISIPFYSQGRMAGGNGSNGGGGTVPSGGNNGRRSKLGIAVCVSLDAGFER